MNSLISSLLQNAPTVPMPTSSPQAPAQNPLDQLKDIRLPSAIDSFPYAPGWWILLALLLSLVGFYLYKRYRYQQAIRLLKPARKELDDLRKLSGESLNANAVATLSALLKRVCLLYFPHSQVASLSGARWLTFLNSQTNQHSVNTNSRQNEDFSAQDIELFSTAAYKKDANIAPQQWLNLITSSEKCIEHIIIDAAKKKVKPAQRKLANTSTKNIFSAISARSAIVRSSNVSSGNR